MTLLARWRYHDALSLDLTTRDRSSIYGGVHSTNWHEHDTHPPHDGSHGALMDLIYRRQRHIYDATRKYYLFGRDTLIDRMGCTPGQSAGSRAQLGATWPGSDRAGPGCGCTASTYPRRCWKRRKPGRHRRAAGAGRCDRLRSRRPVRSASSIT
jgi:hypothetical protein